MGDPRTLKRKYDTPMHPWRKESIDAEKALLKEYSLKNKQELWRMQSLLRGFRNQAKKLIAAQGAQADQERTQLIKRLQRYGLVQSEAALDDVLNLTIADVLNRRLQSVLHRQGLARSMGQARQFIVHQHVLVDGKKISAPSYFVTQSDEGTIAFAPGSVLVDVEHPERRTEEIAAAVKVEEDASAEKEAKDSSDEKKEKKPAAKKEKKSKPKTEEKPVEAETPTESEKPAVEETAAEEN